MRFTEWKSNYTGVWTRDCLELGWALYICKRGDGYELGDNPNLFPSLEEAQRQGNQLIDRLLEEKEKK